MVWHLVPIDIGLAVSTGVSFQVYRISGAAVVRACQNRITLCAVVGDSRSKFENALSKPVLEDFTCERERMTARADDWRLAWPGFTAARHEAKAKRAGRKPSYLVFRRR
jgi:hypothetical protein